jgi:uncharacterized protein YbbC (DUF1343 family)
MVANTQAVSSGLDRLLREGPALAGLPQSSRIGLLAHPASVDRQAHHALELLHASDVLRVARIFAPEHGLWGHEQDMEHVAEAREPSTGLPVISLYGDKVESLRPRPARLRDLDAVVVDLQDVGSRYYTFVYTLSFVMEAAASVGLPVVVLDRPNPIGGRHVEGPVLHPEWTSFVGRYPLPMRHGMTICELARMFNDTFGIGCDLRVVPMRGWSRGMQFEDTGLPWVPPSPNMPTPATARVYPGGCLIEGTELSEGRGTTQPFELVGAPWIDGPALAASLRLEGLPGAVFRPASFRPMFQKHAGTACAGVQVIVTDPECFRPVATYLSLLAAARSQAVDEFAWRTEPYEFEERRLAIDLLLGRSDLRPMLEQGATLEALEATWNDELQSFLALRERFLLYD